MIRVGLLSISGTSHGHHLMRSTLAVATECDYPPAPLRTRRGDLRHTSGRLIADDSHSYHSPRA